MKADPSRNSDLLRGVDSRESCHRRRDGDLGRVLARGVYRCTSPSRDRGAGGARRNEVGNCRRTPPSVASTGVDRRRARRHVQRAGESRPRSWPLSGCASLGAASWIPALKATRADSIVVLRSE